jgi:hypothetical protein
LLPDKMLKYWKKNSQVEKTTFTNKKLEKGICIKN